MTQDKNDQLEASLRHAGDDLVTEEKFLRELSSHAVLAVLKQPPGPGTAEPRRNLVQWQYQISGDVFIPIFTHISHLSIPVPKPAVAVRVPMRALLAAGGEKRYVINPISPFPFELNPARVAQIRTFFAAQGLDPAEPSHLAPWAFRLPDDGLYAVAAALVTWLNSNEEVDKAYMYELTRGTSSPVVVLGLDQGLDLGLARRLTKVAVEAGADPDTFEVRFLTEEPSHRAGVKGINLVPFYQRPGSSRH